MSSPQSTSPSQRRWYRDRRILAWASYDFANTPFVVLVATVGYATYFKDVVAGGSRSGDFLWGLAGSISMVVVALTAPSTGAYADTAGAKRRLLIVYTAVAVLSTALLATVGKGMIVQGMLFFILANVAFQGGQVFYNAFLPEVAADRELGAVSGLGFAAGYVGALVGLVAALPFFWNGFEEGNLRNIKLLFLVVAFFWAVCSLPAFMLLRDAPRPRSAAMPVDRAAATAATARRGGPAGALIRLREDTLAFRRGNRNVFRYLIAYLLYMDAITTLTAFTAIYARDTIGLTLPLIISLYVISQVTAIPGSYLLGRFADRTGPKLTITGCLALWVVIMVLGVFARNYATFVFIALLAGAATGSLQAVSRSMMAQLSPRDREGEFFGFYALVGRVSAIIGPLLFGAVSSITGNQRLAVASLIALILVGLYLIQGVRVAPPGTPREGSVGQAETRSGGAAA